MLEVDELNHIASWSFDGMLWVNGINRTIGIQWWKHNDCVVMQFTWLLDKNGKEIYEGDIVKIEDQFWGVYRDESYLEYFIMNWESNEPMYSYAHYEVVGNIYETPELINA